MKICKYFLNKIKKTILNLWNVNQKKKKNLEKQKLFYNCNVGPHHLLYTHNKVPLMKLILK